jgi:drug/metabolite transporter (DMT)-like permease
MEGAFAVLGGWLMLNEILSMRGLLGCALMLSGMLLSQLWQFSRTSEKPPYLNSG